MDEQFEGAFDVTSTLNFRAARVEDSSDLAVLADMATRRLTSHLWSLNAADGRSPFAVGREAIRSNSSQFAHFTNWQAAESEGIVVGGLNGYSIQPVEVGIAAPVPAPVVPLNDLKAVAVGTWYISAAAIFEEYQGRGYGTALLTKAAKIATGEGHERQTLMVGSFNEGAYRLYARSGFREWERRPFQPFPGSDDPGEWILMYRDLKQTP